MKVEYVCTTDGRQITSVSTGLIWLGGKAATKPVGLVLMDQNRRPGGRGSNRSWAGWDES